MGRTGKEKSRGILIKKSFEKPRRVSAEEFERRRVSRVEVALHNARVTAHQKHRSALPPWCQGESSRPPTNDVVVESDTSSSDSGEDLTDDWKFFFRLLMNLALVIPSGSDSDEDFLPPEHKTGKKPAECSSTSETSSSDEDERVTVPSKIVKPYAGPGPRQIPVPKVQPGVKQPPASKGPVAGIGSEYRVY